MARHEQDREDLLREATALVRRAEFTSTEREREAIVIGFRRDGAMSIYFGADRAYHFQSGGALRRAFANGSLIKSVKGELIRMERRRTETESQLISSPLSREASEAFLAEGVNSIKHASEALKANHLKLVGQIPSDDSNLIDQILLRLAELSRSWTIADRPHVG